MLQYCPQVINDDYQDFVSLSTKLVNVDGSLARMQGPLLELQVVGGGGWWLWWRIGGAPAAAAAAYGVGFAVWKAPWRAWRAHYLSCRWGLLGRPGPCRVRVRAYVRVCVSAPPRRGPRAIRTLHTPNSSRASWRRHATALPAPQLSWPRACSGGRRLLRRGRCWS